MLAIQQAKSCASTCQQLTKIANAATPFINALISKIPKAAQGVAKQQADKINAILADAEASFTPDKCIDA